MAKKVNMFTADKAMSDRVAEFMRCKVWGITLKTRLRKEIGELETKIANVKNLKGSILDKGDAIEKMIVGYQEEIKAAEEKCEKQLEEEAKFDYTENDNKFFKAYKAAENRDGVTAAVREWCECKEYHLDIADTTFLDNIVEAISGARKLGASAIIRSEAKKFTNDKRSKGDILAILYGRLAEKMLEAGTLKAEKIPEDIRAYYAPKKNK